MKKRIFTSLIILSIVFCFANKVHSQSKFQIDYYSNFSVMDLDIFAGVKQTPGGYAIAGMVSGVSAPLIQSVLIATDTAGTVTWAKEIKDGGFLSFKNLYVNDLQTTASGGYVMTGSFDDNYAMLLKVDAAGNAVFSNKYGAAPKEFGNTVRELSSGGYIVGGVTYGKSMNPNKDSSSVYVFKTDANGNYLWGRSYTLTSPVFDSYDAVNDVVEVSNGYVFAGYHSQQNGSDTTTNILVFKTDASGTLQWMKSYGTLSNNEGAFSIKLKSNGNLLVGGYTDQAGIGATSIAVMELDGSGNLVSSRAYSVGLLANMLGSIQETSSGGYAIIGWTVSVFYQSFLLNLNSAYTPVSAKTYNTFIGGLFTKGEEVPGGYIIGSMIGTTGYQLHMIKTDANGSSGSGCTEANANPVQYAYTPPVTTINPTVHTGGSGSVFTVSLTNASPTANIECITLPLIVDAGIDHTICNGSCTPIGGTPTANFGTSPYTYSWSPSTGLSSTTDANPEACPNTTTVYNVTVTDSDGNTGSSQTGVIVIPINPEAGPDITLCIGESTQLIASGGNTYAWSPATGLSATDISDPIATPTVTTTYTVTVDNGACTATDDVTVTVVPAPVANAGPDVTICNGTSTTLNASGGSVTAIYAWSPGTGLSNPNIFNPVASPAATTTYTVTVADGGCADTDEMTITVLPAPPVSAGPDASICIGGSTTLTATSAGTGVYQWSTGASTASINVSPVLTTTYSVTLTYSNGCSPTDNVVVTVNPIPDIDSLTSNPGGWAYQGQLITFIAWPQTFDTYYFYIGSTLMQSGSSYVFMTNDIEGGQYVSVYGSELGCESESDSLSIVLKPIPNAFTPYDIDGVNDLFVKGLDLTIINRWGQKLYEGTDGWDGTYNGDLVSPGTYFYVIHLYDMQNEVKDELKGSVTVVNNK